MREIKPHSIGAFLLLGIALIYALVLIIAPLIAIFQGALAKGLEPILETLSDPNVRHALEITFYMAAGATLMNTVFGVVTAWVLERQQFRGNRFLNWLVDIPFVFSPVIAGYTLIVLFGRDGLITPPFPIVFALPGILLATMFVTLPFVPREVAPVLKALPISSEEAAYTLGANRWTTFRHVVLPGIWVGVVYGVVLTLARALGEFGAVAVVGGGVEGYTETATMFVHRALLDRNREGAYIIALLLGILAILLLLIMTWLQHRMNLYRERTSHVHSTE